VVDLDAGRHRPLDADAVGTHDRLDRLAVRARDGDVQRVGVLVAELEDVADLDALDDLERAAAADARLPRLGRPQVGPVGDGDVPGHVHPAQVHVVGVGAGHHAGPVPQREVGDDRPVGDADRAERARVGAERGEDLVRLGRTDRDGAGGVDELLLLERVVAAEQDQRELAVENVDEGLDLAVARRVVAGGQVLDRPHARRVEPLGRVQRDGRVQSAVDGRDHRHRRLGARADQRDLQFNWQRRVSDLNPDTLGTWIKERRIRGGEIGTLRW
jgi:hypothetical protein